MLLGADSTMLEARVPVVSICAVRTGCGKSLRLACLSNEIS